MHQRWEELLFLHWEVEPETIQATLPPGLHVDTWKDAAFLGVVPFFMRGVRPAWFPPVPGISNFLELNVRTYVHDEEGTPGVWFYSLDANQPLAVITARALFHLNYVHARMATCYDAEGYLHYTSQRRDGTADCEFVYRAGRELGTAEPGSLEFFLAERYRLFCVRDDRLLVGAVHHRPYPLVEPEVKKWNEQLLPANGFEAVGRAPDHRLMSPGVEVEVFGLEKAGAVRA